MNKTEEDKAFIDEEERSTTDGIIALHDFYNKDIPIVRTPPGSPHDAIVGGRAKTEIKVRDDTIDELVNLPFVDDDGNVHTGLIVDANKVDHPENKDANLVVCSRKDGKCRMVRLSKYTSRGIGAPHLKKAVNEDSGNVRTEWCFYTEFDAVWYSPNLHKKYVEFYQNIDRDFEEELKKFRNEN